MILTMKEEQENIGFKAVIKETQTFISLSYILAVGIGMLFNFRKYSAFGINIFDYADVLDFLIAPFADVRIIFFTLLSLLIAYIAFRADLYWERKYPHTYAKMSFGLYKKSWYALYRYVSYLLLIVFYLYLSAGIYAKSIKKNIKEQPEMVLRFADNEVEKGILIGKTKEMIFLLSNDKVKAIPITSLLKELELK